MVGRGRTGTRIFGRFRWALAAAVVLAAAGAAGLAVSLQTPAAADVDARAADVDAQAVVERAVDAVGGEALLRSMQLLRLEGVRGERLLGIAFDLELAPELSGHFTELRDVKAGVARRTIEGEMIQRSEPLRFTATLASTSSEDAADELARAPERLLVQAMEAPDLRWSDSMIIDGEIHDIVTFGDPPIHLLVNRATGLPRGWHSVRAYPDDPLVWAVWGDVETRARWGGWSLEPSGLRYPRLQTIFRNGMRYRTLSITGLEVDPAVDADSMPDATDVRSRPAAQIGPDAREIAPGIVFLPGQFHTFLVRQDDGVVILGAPQSVAYSRLVLAEAARRFPDRPVTAVIASSHAWPHLAGIREYVARGVPVLTAPGNVELIERITAAPHRLVPDSLQRAPRRPDIRGIAARTSLGTGENRIELLPGGSAASPRSSDALLAYVADHQLLYAADVFVPRRFEPTFWRQVMYELTTAVKRRELSPEVVVAMHLEPTPWTALLEEARSSGGLPESD